MSVLPVETAERVSMKFGILSMYQKFPDVLDFRWYLSVLSHFMKPRLK